MDNAGADDTVPSAGPADSRDQVWEDPYPDGTVFRVWSLFVRAIIYGAGLGILFAAVVTGISAVQSGGTWFWALPVVAFFAGLAGAVVGTVAATGALIAVLVFDRFVDGPAPRRAVIAGIGAAVLVGAGWVVFARSTWTPVEPAMILVPGVVGAAVAGGLAWLTVRRVESPLRARRRAEPGRG